jgi:hypothetical protein
LPNAVQAVVPEQKIAAYLLSETHPDGRSKARFFLARGFSRSEWETLATALRDHAAQNDVVENVETPFGVRYVVEGPLHSPGGSSPKVRVVWFIDRGADSARLVTAYPAKPRK